MPTRLRSIMMLGLLAVPAHAAAVESAFTGIAPSDAAVTALPDGFAAPFPGWQVLGPLTPVAAPQPNGRTGVRLQHNTTLVSPSLEVPAGTRTLAIGARGTGGVLLTVRARREGAGGTVTLGQVRPLPSGAARLVDVTSIAGQRVRLVLDPSGGFGALIDLMEVGPFATPLPGWSVLGPIGISDAALHAEDARTRLVTPRVARPPGTSALEVDYRGSGEISVAAGAGPLRRAAGAGWRRIRVRVPATPTMRLTLTLDARDGSLSLRTVGRAVITPRIRVRGARRGNRRVVTGRIWPPSVAGGRMVLRSGTRIIARTTSSRRGRFRFVVSARAKPLSVVSPAGIGVVAARVRVPTG